MAALEQERKNLHTTDDRRSTPFEYEIYVLAIADRIDYPKASFFCQQVWRTPQKKNRVKSGEAVRILVARR